MRERISKGATRPAVIKGVPLVPAVVICVPCAMAGFAGMTLLNSLAAPVAAAVVIVLALGWMHAVTRKDDQRVLQLLRRARLQLQHFNRHVWRCRSYSPIAYKEGSDAWRP